MAAASVLRDDHGRNQILIGKDTRISGYLIESALTAGICSMGMNVTLVGPIPTPGIAFLTRALRLDAGVAISASHNPFEITASRYSPPQDSSCRMISKKRLSGCSGRKLPFEKTDRRQDRPRLTGWMMRRAGISNMSSPLSPGEWIWRA